MHNICITDECLHLTKFCQNHFLRSVTKMKFLTFQVVLPYHAAPRLTSSEDS